jgi:CRISPR type I-E-associated protein CasA/Cse1
LSGIKGESFTGSNFTSGVLFWGHGDTLFETLMLNLMPPSDVMPVMGDDRPCWEMDDAFTPARQVPMGYLDYLTWQSNRVLYFPEETAQGIRVAQMTIAPGLSTDANVMSPQKRYEERVKKTKGKPDESYYSMLYFNSSKALWRDYSTLLALDSDTYQPPKVVEWYHELVSDYILDKDYPLRLMASGMLADQAKPLFYRQEFLRLPKVFLQNPMLARFIDLAVEDADKVASDLDRSLKILAEHVLIRGGERKPDSGDVRGLVQQWDAAQVYWLALEQEFWQFIDALAKVENSNASQEILDNWHSVLKREARQALDYAMGLCGTDVGALKGQAIATRQLNIRMKKLFDKESS